MKMHKLAPLALAAMLAAGASAAAAEQPQAAEAAPSAVYAGELREGKFEHIFSLLCGKPENGLPEQTPDTDKPENGLPEQTPDTDKPESGLPEQTPDNTPDSTPEVPEQGEDAPQGDYAAQVVALVNAERAKYGLSALRVDSRVQQAAQVRAAETVQSFSHTRPNGASFSTALTEAGVSYTRSGENIAYGQSTPQQVVQAWMNSDGHRANILNGGFTTIGVGYTVVNGTAYWAQLFTA